MDDDYEVSWRGSSWREDDLAHPATPVVRPAVSGIWRVEQAVTDDWACRRAIQFRAIIAQRLCAEYLHALVAAGRVEQMQRPAGTRGGGSGRWKYWYRRLPHREDV